MNVCEDIGFLGLGHMGSAIAERLLRPGIRLHVYDPSTAAAESFASKGATVHSSPRAVANAATLVFACLPSQAISKKVVFDTNGVLHGTRIQTYIETSTIGTSMITEIADGFARRDVEVLDAPVTGGPERARAGMLAVLVSGSSSRIEAVLPTLRLLGKDICVLGHQVGMAQLMKLINNLVMATNMVAMAEGLVLGAKAGLTAESMMQVLAVGSGRSTAGCDILGRSILEDNFNFGAALSIIDKDVRAGLDEAELRGITIPVIDQAHKTWRKAYDNGKGDDDFTTIIHAMEAWSGVRVSAR